MSKLKDHHLLSIELTSLQHGFDGRTCWVQARGGVIPPSSGNDLNGVITMQQLRLDRSDVFSGLSMLKTLDCGRSWIGPEEQTGLDRRSIADDQSVVIADFTPQWHAATQTLLGTGQSAYYRGDQIMPPPRPRQIAYAVFDAAGENWKPWRTVELPDGDTFFSAGAGSSQRVDLPDGDILLPIYFRSLEAELGNQPRSCMTLRCTFDGETLAVRELGTPLALSMGRGLSEPSLIEFQGTYYLTIRTVENGLVSISKDGLQFTQPIPWCFDDGDELGIDNTQQHWISLDDTLYLLYTRRGLDNNHVFRHRAPLMIAEVDPVRLCVLRQTERVVVPERGARLGNFSVINVSPNEAWIVVAEWMQTTGPDVFDYRVCQQHGSDNNIYLTKLRRG